MNTLYRLTFYSISTLFTLVFIGVILVLFVTLYNAATNDDPPSWREVCLEREEVYTYVAMGEAGVLPVNIGSCLRNDYVCKAGFWYEGPIICLDPKPKKIQEPN